MWSVCLLVEGATVAAAGRSRAVEGEDGDFVLRQGSNVGSFSLRRLAMIDSAQQGARCWRGALHHGPRFYKNVLPVSFGAAAGQVSSGGQVLSVGPGPAGCL